MSGLPPAVRIILDQGVPRDAAPLLRAAGLICDHVSELGMSRADDTEILECARARSATVLTLDADFHAILAVSGSPGPSVIRVRRQGLLGATIANLALHIVREFSTELQNGCLITVKPRKTTCHKLPISAK